MKLGTAFWMEGATERRALVAELPGDPGRVVDLHRVERVRLTKLGEGRADLLAEALVPPSLRQALDAGPRGLHRLHQTLAYAEKWRKRGDLPEHLAPSRAQVKLLACLPRPASLRRADGQHLDRLTVQGPGGVLRTAPTPTLAAIGLHGGLHGGRVAGFCLALEDGDRALLGAWLHLEPDWSGHLELKLGKQHRALPLEGWADLSLPRLHSGEVLLLPPPRLKPFADLAAGLSVSLDGFGENLTARLGKAHPTVQ